jgi:hypothetical protein
MGYDPATALEKLEIPVLWIFGLYDGVIPVRLSIDRIGELQKAGRRNHFLRIFPFGNHNFENVMGGPSYSVSEASRAWARTAGFMDREYLEELKKGTSEDHARIEWTRQILQARLNPLMPTAADLVELTGPYAGGRAVIQRDGKLIYRRADGVERELIPLTKNVFALGEVGSAVRFRFNRSNNRVTGFSFLRLGIPAEDIAREAK